MPKPIPKKLLIHNIVYQEMGESDGWNTSPAGDPVPVNFVRVQPISRANRSANSQGTTAEHELFIDRTHSSEYFEFKVGAEVTFKNKIFKVADVSPMYDFDTVPHHYEIGLN